MKSELLLPGAVVLGATIIGAGLFFGLRARPAEAPAVASTSPGSPPSFSAPTPAPLPPVRDAGRAKEDATRALQAYKEEVLLPRCWIPALKSAPSPTTARYQLSLSFGADGKEIGRGLNEERGLSRSDVTACIQQQTQPLSIPPPGAPVNLLLPVEFP